MRALSHGNLWIYMHNNYEKSIQLVYLHPTYPNSRALSAAELRKAIRYDRISFANLENKRDYSFEETTLI